VTPPSAAAGRGTDPWRLVPALGLAQIISWGALYYAIAVLGAAIGADLGLSPAHVFGAYSTGLLLSGLTAPVTGRAIDRWSGRIVLTIGSLVAALALFWLSRVSSALEYYLAWCVGGVAMGLTLYDPAFATLSQHFGTSYRQALTALTLFGGFASTVFWPLAQFGLVRFGWRDTLAAFALLELAVCLPLHWWLIPAHGRAAHGEAPDDCSGAARPPARGSSPQFVALASSFALNAFVFSAMSAHLIGMMRGGGMTADDAVWIAALIGPMQVAGRIVEITFGRNLRAATVGIVAVGLLMVSMLVLLAGARISVSAALTFAVFYGLSNGVMTIVRGTVPAEFFGRAAYGSLLGRLAAPSLVARAAAPVALAALAAPQVSPRGSILVLLLLAALSAAAFIAAIRYARRGAGAGGAHR
jgi:hypothetical protein